MAEETDQPPVINHEEIFDRVRVKPGSKVKLKDFETDWDVTAELRDLGEDVFRERARQLLDDNRRALAEAQELLYASDTYSLLIIFQAMDAAGKDGTIKHVMSGINPQGCQVFSFKAPSAEELDHTFLWRCMKALPERGRIGIFNRSYYEEVLVVKVHPKFLDAQRLPVDDYDDKFWRRRYKDINAFEKHLVRNGTLVLKFFLNVSKEEQKKRFLDRLNDPTKHWKFSVGDLAERARWDEYMAAYEDMLSATSTKHAPWYVIPADQKWAARAMVAMIITDTINGLGLKYPQVGEEAKAALDEARRQLEQEDAGRG